MKKNLFIICVFFLLLGCDKESEIEQLIIGTWVQEDPNNSMVIAKKSNIFVNELPGISFQKDGSLIKRTNADSNFEEPINYADYQGAWTQLNDSMVSIFYAFLNGVSKYDLYIIDVNQLTLTYTVIFDY